MVKLTTPEELVSEDLKKTDESDIEVSHSDDIKQTETEVSLIFIYDLTDNKRLVKCSLRNIYFSLLILM